MENLIKNGCYPNEYQKWKTSKKKKCYPNKYYIWKTSKKIDVIQINIIYGKPYKKWMLSKYHINYPNIDQLHIAYLYINIYKYHFSIFSISPKTNLTRSPSLYQLEAPHKAWSLRPAKTLQRRWCGWTWMSKVCYSMECPIYSMVGVSIFPSWWFQPIWGYTDIPWGYPLPTNSGFREGL